MTIILTNGEIYNYASNIINNFSEKNIKFPVKVNFYLQKNWTELITLAQDIEQQRNEILSEYEQIDKNTQQVEVPKDKVLEVSKKIKDLFSLTQEVKIYKVKLEDFGNMELTTGQMQALLFMIENDEVDDNND